MCPNYARYMGLLRVRALETNSGATRSRNPKDVARRELGVKPWIPRIGQTNVGNGWYLGLLEQARCLTLRRDCSESFSLTRLVVGRSHVLWNLKQEHERNRINRFGPSGV